MCQAEITRVQLLIAYFSSVLRVHANPSIFHCEVSPSLYPDGLDPFAGTHLTFDAPHLVRMVFIVGSVGEKTRDFTWEFRVVL